MIIFLALVLIILMILIGGERGAVSLMTLAGNIVILFISILLMSIGFPALLLILAAGAGVCYNSLFYQNGNNPKTRAAFLATLLVMLLLFIPIYLIIWRSGSYGLNELQLSEDDFMYYYSTDIHINMLHVAVFVTVFSTLGAVIDTALSVTSSVYEVWTHKKQPDSERTYFFRLSGWKRNYRNNCKYAAFCLSWRLYSVICLCSDTAI